MKAKYCGRKVERDDAGVVVRRYKPMVEITMKSSEVERFYRIMNWISDHVCDYTFDTFGDNDTVYAYVHVDHKIDGEWFMHDYKDAKKALHYR